MIAPPDFETLESRLRGRGDNVTEDVLRSRLDKANVELSQLGEYDYVIVNRDGEIERAALDIIGVINAEKHSVTRNKEFKHKFFA